METPEKSNPVDINQFIRMVLRRKWFFIVPAVLIPVIFTAASFLLPSIYEARAIVLIEEQKVINPLLENLAISVPVKEKLNSIREEILSWPRLFQLVEKLGLSKNINHPLEFEHLIAMIRRSINLRMASDEIITISYQSKDPKITQTLVNTLCDILINQDTSSQIEETASAIDFINDQLNVYKTKLNESETELRKFKEVYGFHKMESSGEITPSMPQAVEETSTFGAPLKKVNDELATLEADLVMATVDCTDEHPRVIDLKRRIETLKEKRVQYIREVAGRAGVEPQSYVDIADSFPRQQEELTRLTRDKIINEKIYAMLLERLETAKITERLDKSDSRTKFKIIEPARYPYAPVKPNRLLLFVLGIALGFAVGFGLVYAIDYMDPSFKNEDRLKETYDIPVLGNISKLITAEDVLRRKAAISRAIPFVSGFAIILIGVIFVIGKTLLKF